MQLRDYQKDCLHHLESLMPVDKNMMVKAPCAWGKCQHPETPILMFDGSIKLAKNIIVGDNLMGPDSKKRRVLSICSGEDEMYRVSPIKGDSYVFNEAHILTLRAGFTEGGHVRGELYDVPIRDWFSKSQNFRNKMKWARVAVEFKDRDVEFDPYFVGLYLADGHKHSNAITKPDEEIYQYLKNNFTITNITDGMTYFLQAGTIGRNLSALSRLRRELCLENDRLIPDRYKINSREKRLKLLAGLLDGDGYHYLGGFEISTKYESLNKDILFLARSLGFAAYSVLKKSTIKSTGFEGMYYRIKISGDLICLPMKIERKKPSKRKMNKSVLNVGFDIEPIGNGTYCGFELSGDGRYLLGDFSVTHNTNLFIELVRNFKGRVLIILNRVMLLKQTQKRFIESGQDCGIVCGSLGENDSSQRITIATIQTIKQSCNEFDLIIIDECHQATSKSYVVFLRLFKGNVIGFTATPFNSFGYLYGEHSDIKSLAYECSMNEMIEKGYLTPISFKQVNESFDLTGVETVLGDYNIEQLDKLAQDKTKLDKQVTDALSKMNGRKKAVWVCVSIEHAIMVAQTLISRGEKTSILHSKLSKEEMIKELHDFEVGDNRHMVSISMITQGYDFPPIDCIVMLRPTRAPDLFVQIIGRSMRLYPEKKDALFLDFGHVVENLGHPNEPLIRRKFHKQLEENQVKEICPQCYEMLFERFKICPKCAHVFVRAKRPVVVDKTKNLSEVAWSPGITDEDLEMTIRVSRWEIDDKWISGKGNKCTKISYFNGFGMEAHTEYISHLPTSKWVLDKFNAETLQGTKMPVRIRLKKDGKSRWWRTVKREYF